MSFDVDSADQAAAALERVLSPLGQRAVDLNDPEWRTKLLARPKPLDKAGVRTEAEALLGSLLEAYAEGDLAQRELIRTSFVKYPTFAWATGVSEPATSPHGFRQHLLHLSALNGTGDLRDTIVGLEQLFITARRAGVAIDPLLKEVEDLSSDSVVHGIDSLRGVMKKARERFSFVGRIKSALGFRR